jgi:hypothetical protein
VTPTGPKIHETRNQPLDTVSPMPVDSYHGYPTNKIPSPNSQWSQNSMLHQIQHPKLNGSINFSALSGSLPDHYQTNSPWA